MNDTCANCGHHRDDHVPNCRHEAVAVGSSARWRCHCVTFIPAPEETPEP